MRRYLLAVALMLPTVAFGQAVCGQTTSADLPRDAALLCWTNATQDVNGNPLPPFGEEGSIKTTRIQRAYMASATTPCDFAASAEPLQTINLTPEIGQYYFPSGLKVGRHCFRARHINTKDVMSDWSPIVWKAIAPLVVAKPKRPENVYSVGQGTGAETAAAEDPTEDFE